MRLSFAVLFALLPAIIATPIKDTGIAPLSSNGKTIEDSYIVVFKKDVNIDQIALHLDGVTTWNLANVSIDWSNDLVCHPDCDSGNGDCATPVAGAVGMELMPISASCLCQRRCRGSQPRLRSRHPQLLLQRLL